MRTKPQNHMCPFFFPPTTFPGTLQSKEAEMYFSLLEAKLEKAALYRAYFLFSLFLTCRLESSFISTEWHLTRYAHQKTYCFWAGGGSREFEAPANRCQSNPTPALTTAQEMVPVLSAPY